MSGDNAVASARFVEQDELPLASEELVRSYVETYIAAKALANAQREKKAEEKKPTLTPMEALLGQLTGQD